MMLIRRPAWTEQPRGLPRLRRDHPFGALLDSVWLPQGGGLDHEGGIYTPLPSTASTAPHPRGLALTNTGSTDGTVANIRAVNAFPFVLFAYGYFNTSAANYRLARIRNAAGASVAEIILLSGTQLALRAQGSGGTQRTLAVTVTGGMTSNPMLAIAVARSSTDYSLYVNGQSADGTLDFGSSISMDRAWAFGGNLNGGLFAMGYGAGRTLPADMLLDITRDPRLLWEAFEPRRVGVPVQAAAGGGASYTADVGGVSSTAAYGALNGTYAAPVYTATLSDISSAASLGSIGATYVAPNYTATLAAVSSPATFSAVNAAYSAPGAPSYDATLAGVSASAAYGAANASYAAPAYTATLAGLAAAAVHGAAHATYTAPLGPAYSAALAGIAAAGTLSQLNAGYEPPSTTRASIPADTLAAADAGPLRPAQLSAAARPAQAGSARRPLQQ